MDDFPDPDRPVIQMVTARWPRSRSRAPAETGLTSARIFSDFGADSPPAGARSWLSGIRSMIMPAATVPLLIGSTTMKLPVSRLFL